MGIHRDLAIHGLREPWSTMIFLRELRRGYVMIDIGANIGYYTCLACKVLGSDGHIYAVEPLMENLSFLVRNLELNKCSETVSIYKLALGDHDGYAFMEYYPHAPNISKVVSTSSKNSKTLKQVRMITLDNFVKQLRLEKVDFLKMDVEGYEVKILRGGINTLESFRPKIFVEIHPEFMYSYGNSFYEFVDILDSLSYSVKYVVWEPLTSFYLESIWAKNRDSYDFQIVKGPLPIRTLLREPLRKFIRNWTKLFLEASETRLR
jgi:FkbM family methyltransferase